MSQHPEEKASRLIAALREGVSLVQMVFYKEVKNLLIGNHPDQEVKTLMMLAAAITNELFGTPNPDPGFTAFRQQHRALIEAELGSLAANLPHLCPYVTDALRVQTLCDKQQGIEDPGVLQTAESLGILIRERPLPLPSAFITLVRGLGEQHQLIIAPVQISPEDDRSLTH
ncbi:MAG: hypothetical protein LJE64_05485 [Desulfofustis sp.]|jgi:hypothetical protein|nr:hypothetical protein [Desulfofustis sp.]